MLNYFKYGGVFPLVQIQTQKHFHFKNFYERHITPRLNFLAHKGSATDILNVDKKTSQRYYTDRSMSEHHTAPPTSEDLEIL